MDISTALATNLAVLARALEDPGVVLETELRTFAADVKHAVASYTGMAMTMVLDGHDVSFTVHDDPPDSSDTAASLLIPLAALTETDAASTVVLYAATPGAFVDLAADLSFALGIDPVTLVLDAHVPAVHDGLDVTSLDAHFAIDQAIGVLIGRGHTPETARDELHRLAAVDHGDLRAVAENVVLNAGTPPTDTA